MPGAKPLAALERLRAIIANDPAARSQWLAQAKVAAVMGSCPRSHKSFKSGVRHWIEFIAITHGDDAVNFRAFPPRMDDVLAWTSTFRCAGTFCNYLSYVRCACHAIGCAAPEVGHPALKRATVAIVKRSAFQPRAKLFIDKVCVTNMVMAVARELEEQKFAMLWLLSYTFLLRLPSEALPTCKGTPETAEVSEQQAVIWRDGDFVCFRLLRRKNRPQGSGVLRRKCSCGGGRHTCAVHTLWDAWFAELPVGSQPWALISPANARDRIRRILGLLGVGNAHLYGTQDFRRGHAEACLFWVLRPGVSCLSQMFGRICAVAALRWLTF